MDEFGLILNMDISLLDYLECDFNCVVLIRFERFDINMLLFVFFK